MPNRSVVVFLGMGPRPVFVIPVQAVPVLGFVQGRVPSSGLLDRYCGAAVVVGAEGDVAADVEPVDGVTFNAHIIETATDSFRLRTKTLSRRKTA